MGASSQVHSETLEQWRSSNFAPQEIAADPSPANDWADPDNDGRRNFLEFALGENPKMANPGSGTVSSVEIVNGEPHVTLTYNRRKNSAEVRYFVEVTQDLKTWASGPETTTETLATDLGEFEQVVVRDNTPLSAGVQRFLRLRVERAGIGLLGEYYAGYAFNEFRARVIDPFVDIYLPYGSPNPAVGVDYFSIRWTGMVEAEFSETYTFHTLSDDGVRLWVNGALLIDNWTFHSTTENYGAITLEAGKKYEIKLEYFEATGGAVCQLDWSSPSRSRQRIPKEHLYPTTLPPIVAMTSPYSGAFQTLGSTVSVSASASVLGGWVDRVTFFANGEKIGEQSSAPYTISWTPPAAGNYVLSAQAMDQTGAVGTSSPVNLMISSQSLMWEDRLLKADGTLNTAEYLSLAASYDQAWAVDYRFGPRWGDFHSGTVVAVPTVWTRTGELPLGILRDAHGNENRHNFQWQSGWLVHGNRSMGPPEGDWYSQSGNLLYVPDSPTEVGLARARAFADYHEGHGGANLTHAFDLKISWTADAANYFNVNPDPAAAQPGWASPSGAPATRPIAIARSRTMHVAWPSIVIFRDGLIGATSNGNAPDTFPSVRLPSHKVPTDVALTQNNEFALISVWNTQTLSGELAVVAIRGRFPQSDTAQYFGLPNGLEFTGLKILGYVELPGMSAPTAVSAVGNVTKVLSGRGGQKLPTLSLQSERDNWYQEIDGLHRVSTAGFALVSSRSENKVALVDLEPLFQYYRTMYLTTAGRFASTENMGAAPNQWPYDFSVAPEARPVVSRVLSVDRPTAVVAGYPYPSDWTDGAGWEANNDFSGQAWIATMSGQLQIYSVPGLFNSGPAGGAQLLKTVFVGANPTSINVGRASGYSRVFVTSRGDRIIHQLDLNGNIRKSLRDSRLVDPVAATGSTGRGPSMLSVMDFGGRQVLNYMRESINVWGDEILGGLGQSGTDDFEFTHSQPVSGLPFAFDVTEVN